MSKVDTGWAWVCLAASCLTFLFISALDFSIGTLQIALLEIYRGSVAKTSIIVVTSVGSMMCSAPLAGFVVNATNCRICCVSGGILMFVGIASSAFVHDLDALLVTFGIITGLGKSLSSIACSLSVGFSFTRRRSLASGLFATGAGIGIFIGSPVVRFLLEYYGLDGTFLMLSAISLHVSLFGMFLRPTKYELNSRKSCKEVEYRRKSVVENQKDLLKGHAFSNMKLFKDPSFLVFVLCLFSWNFAIAVITVHLQTFSYSTGVSKEDAANLMTLLGVGSTLSRLLVGLSTSSSGLNGTVVFMGQCAVAGTVTLLFPLYAATYIGQLVYCFLHGLYTGGLYSQLIPLTTEVVDVHLLSPALGINNFVMGIAWLTGPYISGKILDIKGTYFHCFFLSGGCFILAFFLVMLMVLLKRDARVGDIDVHGATLETVPLSHHDIAIEF